MNTATRTTEEKPVMTLSDSDRLAIYDRWYQEQAAKAKAHPRTDMRPPTALREKIGALPEIPCPCQWCQNMRAGASK